MDPKELKKLIKTLRSLGITHYKNGNVELTLAPLEVVVPPKPVEKPVEISPEEEKEIKHKVEELTSIMKLGDVELLDRLFPDHTEYEAQDAHEVQ